MINTSTPPHYHRRYYSYPAKTNAIFPTTFKLQEISNYNCKIRDKRV